MKKRKKNQVLSEAAPTWELENRDIYLIFSTDKEKQLTFTSSLETVAIIFKYLYLTWVFEFYAIL